ncbi:MAG TPA: hypothetical protein VGI56_07745 [Galbitalea sp.]|jgi:uncharacterized protein with FMN-binding domain
MSHPVRTKTTIAAFAGLSLVGALAGCSSTPAASAQGDASVSDPATGSTTSANSSFKDGTYTAPGTYVSPGGTEHISVKLTLKNQVVTALTVTTVEADPTATGYEQMFEGGIDAVVVGKKINDLNVGVVAGSSLTSQGFNRALDAIKAQAKS